jgi:hypothetical protein
LVRRTGTAGEVSGADSQQKGDEQSDDPEPSAAEGDAAARAASVGHL